MGRTWPSCCLPRATPSTAPTAVPVRSTSGAWRSLGVEQHPNLHLVEYDLTDLSASIRLLQTTQATEVYNLAAQSFVGVSFDQPVTTAEITGLGAVNLLEAIRIVNPKARFYQASTSEMFGKVQQTPRSKVRRSTRAVPMVSPSFMRIG